MWLKHSCRHGVNVSSNRREIFHKSQVELSVSKFVSLLVILWNLEVLTHLKNVFLQSVELELVTVLVFKKC